MRRVRPPQFFNTTGGSVLQMYNVGTSAGEECLARVSNSRFWGEGYCWHVMLSAESKKTKSKETKSKNGKVKEEDRDDWVLVSTNHRIMLVHQFELVWQLPWKDLLPETVTANTKEQEEKNDQQEKEKKEKGEQMKSKWER